MPQSPTHSLSLDDLIALNDELAALAKAGVPLGDALAGLGDDLPAGLARVSQNLAERMNRGQSLPDALAAAGDQFPPLYRALVTAGIRSGRLPAALEQLSATARRMAMLRRLIAGALVYPLLVVLLGYGLFLFFVLRIAPVLDSAAPLATLEQPPHLLQAVGGLQEHVQWWGPILPAVVVTLLAAWWFRSRRATMLQGGTAAPILGAFAPVRRLLAESQAAGFADTLALLVEHQIPLADALVLAGEASGDAAILRSARQFAAEVSAGGGSSSEITKRAGAIPPLLRWLIISGGGQANLVGALRQNADMYRRRAIARADWLRWRLPVILTVTIGGTATLIYALSLFAPWISLLKELARSCAAG